MTLQTRNDPSTDELKTCWLLQLSPELLHRIFDECPQISRARMARTCSALLQVYKKASFRTVHLYQYDGDAWFREACRANPNRKNQIQSLFLVTAPCREPLHGGWIEWFRRDSAITPMASLRNLSVGCCASVGDNNYDLWDLLELISITAPNIQTLSVVVDDTTVAVTQPRGYVSGSVLSRLCLHCKASDWKMLEQLGRSLPAVSTVHIFGERKRNPLHECFEALKSFSRLRNQRVDEPWWSCNQELTLEFPHLATLIIHDEYTTSSDVITQLFLPNLQQLGIIVLPGTNIEETALSLTSNRLPRLSVIDIVFTDSNKISAASLFAPLRGAGYTFELYEEGRGVHISVMEYEDEETIVTARRPRCWRERRGECEANSVSPFFELAQNTCDI